MVDCTVPYFGFKAKQAVYDIPQMDYCTVPYFGFKAKQVDSRPTARVIVLCLILDSRQNIKVYELIGGELYCALFWIQGKTNQIKLQDDENCTVPYFGFKAKPVGYAMSSRRYCTVPYFGFKAKP